MIGRHFDNSAAPTATEDLGAFARAGAVLTVDLGAFQHNWRTLGSRLADGGFCGAVLKADAYGCGAVEVGRALAAAGCDTFFVALPDEAIALRAALGKGPRIFVLGGVFPEAAGDYLHHDLLPTLNHPGDIETWRNQAKAVGRPLRAALHLDTGMNRLGLSRDETTELANAPHALEGISVDLFMSHLACADMPVHPMNERQRADFAERLRLLAAVGLEGPASLSNSGGILLGADYHHAVARPGILLHGVAPDAASPDQAVGLRPCVALRARILQVRAVDRPMTVGYGAAHAVTKPTKIAIISVGYADGLIRSLSDRGFVVLAGHRLPYAGRVSMDMIAIDASAAPEGLVVPGAWVDVIGPDVRVEDVAIAAGTIGNEVLTSLGARYARRYLSAGLAGAPEGGETGA